MSVQRAPKPSVWSLRTRRGPAADLHAIEPDLSGREIRVNVVDSPSIVLGSAQAAARSTDQIDLQWAREMGYAIATRRSGGGLVHLIPDAQVWVDLFLPRGDELWIDDVGRSTDWLGQVWVDALNAIGVHRTEVHRGTWSDPVLGRQACFAAVGPGEITVGGRKLVGISQRRDRLGARFQCVVYLRWDPTPVLRVLRVKDGDRMHSALTSGVTDLGSLSGTALSGTALSGTALLEALVGQLP